MRRILPLSTGWRYQKTKAFPPTGKRSACPIPGTPRTGRTGGNDYWRGTACYAKELTLPQMEEGTEVYLEVNGAAMVASVYLNGKQLCCHEGCYSTFRVPLKDLQDTNLLCITVDNSENDHVYPQKADFTFYGGLYREVNLLLIASEHCELEKDGTPGVKVTPVVDLEAGSATVTVETWQNAPSVTLIVGEESQTIPSEGGHATATFIIPQVHLWDSRKDPFLYEARACLPSGDYISTRFGCRVMGFDPTLGFLLNGKP